jgi:glucans biosynthesis protein C
MEKNRNIWIDYLRSSLTVLVVAHHSTLAYTTFANFDKHVYINSTHPIVDTTRWVGLDIFVNFNDIFFMSLMFLIGGLFLSKSIAKKGPVSFIIDRLYRLFIPFIFLGTLFMLIAYYPSFYVAHSSTNVVAYIKDFFTIERWPVGPPWFIWVLFLFNLLLLLINPVIQKLKPHIVILFATLKNKPVLLFSFLLLFTWLLYVPIAYNIGAGTWTGFGPFDFQLSRILLYFGYFILGVIIGNTDFNDSIFSNNSVIVKRWPFWGLLAITVFIALTIGSKQLEQMVKVKQLKEFNAWMIYYTLYVSSCTFSCLAFITIFRKFVTAQKGWWTSLANNAYLIYLIHYIFVIWIQFLLMDYDMPAFLKFVITFVSSLVLSWTVSNLLRKNRLISKYL